ncbi:hypothetical protein PLICRDRAFT_97162 [Plicaturopsis crispa FD-325 SS-3]|nr:hypothetical protein PLICRDRAFT_97162 [Plicaturopsis crispa FD-325 SS-3]
MHETSEAPKTLEKTAHDVAPNGKSGGFGEDLNYVAEKTRSVFPQPPKFTSKTQEREWTKFRLAQAFRIFGKLGFNEGVAGHITVRDPIKRDCFWVNPFGVHFKLIQPEDLLLVDHRGNVLDESGPNRLINLAAFMIHSEIHAARPDVHCAAHTHSTYGRAFSTFGKPLDMLTQDDCHFYNDHAVYENYNGVVLEADEGKNIAAALGNKKAAILQNHGLLTVSPTIEATVFFFATLEQCCKVQLLAHTAAAGKQQRPNVIGREEAEFTSKTIGTLRGGWFSGLPEFALLEHEEKVSFDFKKGHAWPTGAGR